MEKKAEEGGKGGRRRGRTRQGNPHKHMKLGSQVLRFSGATGATGRRCRPTSTQVTADISTGRCMVLHTMIPPFPRFRQAEMRGHPG